MKDLDKIHQLLASEQRENAQLAISLMQSLEIDLTPYQELVAFYQRYYGTEGSFEEDLMSVFGIERLWLKLQSLEYLPEFISLLPNLKKISCYHNLLKTLPKSIGDMQQLEVLDCYCNRIEELPSCIGQLQQLKRLDLYDNQLKELPESIGELKALEDLNIASNPIKELPESIWKLSNLKVFKLHATSISASTRVLLREKLPKDCKLIY